MNQKINHKDADTPEELTRWIWDKYVGVPVAGDAWGQEYEHLLDRVRRMDRSSFTKGLHEGADQMKALASHAPSGQVWNQGSVLGWLQERSFPHGQGNNAPLIMAVDINVAKEYAQRAYDAGRSTLVQAPSEAAAQPTCSECGLPRDECRARIIQACEAEIEHNDH